MLASPYASLRPNSKHTLNGAAQRQGDTQSRFCLGSQPGAAAGHAGGVLGQDRARLVRGRAGPVKMNPATSAGALAT